MPYELIAGIVSAAVGFIFKAHATAIDGLRQATELQIQAQMTADQLANSAAKRSNPVARKVLAYIVIGGLMFGLLFVGIAYIWNQEAMVSIVGEKEPFKLLWGLMSFGGGTEVTEAHGFVLPPWTGWVVSVMVGFFFGTGAAKPAR